MPPVTWIRLSPRGRGGDSRIGHMFDSASGHAGAMTIERIASAVVAEDEIALESTVRPRRLDEFVGQERIKENLAILIDAARQRGGAGRSHPPRTVRRAWARRRSRTSSPPRWGRRSGPRRARRSSGPATWPRSSPPSNKGDVLFIDEIHRLSHVVEEILYPAMEDFALDIVLGKGPGARTVRLQIEPITVIGATTRVGSITGPLRDRFGVTYRLDYYTPEDLERILRRSAAHPRRGARPTTRPTIIAGRSRGTPRIANRLLKRVRDFAQVRGDGVVTARAARPMPWPCSRSTSAGSTRWTGSCCGRSPSTTAAGRSGCRRWPPRSASRSRRSRT